MKDDFNAVGLKPSLILHVNVTNGEQPKKPVTLSIPVPDGVDESKILTIMQGENDDELVDVTGECSYVLEMGIVSLKIHHFSL